MTEQERIKSPLTPCFVYGCQVRWHRAGEVCEVERLRGLLREAEARVAELEAAKEGK